MIIHPPRHGGEKYIIERDDIATPNAVGYFYTKVECEAFIEGWEKALKSVQSKLDVADQVFKAARELTSLYEKT